MIGHAAGLAPHTLLLAARSPVSHKKNTPKK